MLGKNISQLQSINYLDENGLLAFHFQGQTYKVQYKQFINALKQDVTQLTAIDDIGTIFFSDRLQPPLGCLNYADGSEYTSINIAYPEFYNKLKDNIIYSISYDAYNTQIEQTKAAAGNNGEGWCPFIAFDKDAKKMKMPILNGNQIALLMGSSNSFKTDALPNIAGRANLNSVDSLTELEGVFTDGGQGEQNQSNLQGRNNFSRKLNFSAANSNNIYQAGVNEVRIKSKIAKAYIIVSSTRYVQSGASATTGDLLTEILERQEADTEINNRLDQLNDRMKGAMIAYYRNTYRELETFCNENRLILKTGTLLYCGGLNTGEEFREFIWDENTNSMVERDVNISLDGYPTTVQMNNALRQKQDKIPGKGLSTNDYTDLDKLKVQDAVSNQEFTSTINDINERLLNTIGLENITSYLDEQRLSTSLLPNEQATITYVLSYVTKKMDLEYTFLQNGDINSLEYNNDITGESLDLKSFFIENVEENYIVNFKDRNTDEGLYTNVRFVCDAQHKNFNLEYTLGEESKVVRLINNGFIVNPNIRAGQYYQLILGTYKFIVESRTFKYYYDLEQINEPETYTTFQDETEFSNTFYSSESIAFSLDNTNIKLNVIDYTYLFNDTTEEEFTLEFDTTNDFATYFNELPLNDKAALDQQIIKFNQEGTEYTFSLEFTENIESELTYPSQEDFELAFNSSLNPMEFNNKVITIQTLDSNYIVKVFLKPILKQCFVSPVSGYYIVHTEDVVRPSCKYGSYQEVTIEEIINRLNALEGVLQDGGTRLMKETPTTLYEVDTITVVNGGTGYEVGDKIKIVFPNMTGKDKTGYAVVNSVNELGAVLNIVVGVPGYYFEDIAGNNLYTHNRDNPDANGLMVNVSSKTEQASLLSNYAPTSFNTLCTVILDETRNYTTVQYLWQKNPQGVGEWVFYKVIDTDERDFTIDKIDLTQEVKNILPKYNGGFGQNMQQVITTGEKKGLLVIGTDGVVSKKETDITAIKIVDDDPVSPESDVLYLKNVII